MVKDSCVDTSIELIDICGSADLSVCAMGSSQEILSGSGVVFINFTIQGAFREFMYFLLSQSSAEITV